MPASPMKSSLQVGARSVAIAAQEEDEFSTAETLVDGFRAWLGQLPTFAACAAIVHLPLIAFAFLPALPEPIVIAAFVLAASAAAEAAQGALVKGVLDAERMLNADLGELLQAAARNAARSIAVHFTVLGGALVRIVVVFPGLRWVSDTFVAIPVLAMEPGSMASAMRRSARLAHGARGRILPICAVPWTTAALVAASSGVFAGASFDSLPWLLAFIFARALDTSLAATLSATAYSRLRDRPGL